MSPVVAKISVNVVAATQVIILMNPQEMLMEYMPGWCPEKSTYFTIDICHSSTLKTE